jgi:hypothetical protein
MLSMRIQVATAIAITLGGPLGASGGNASGSADTTAELKLRIPDEIAPAGAMVQMKVLTTEVTPISGGRPGFTLDSTFDAAAGFSLPAPSGEIAGAAVVGGSHVDIFYDGTSLLTANYPVLTTVLHIRSDAPAGAKAPFSLDPGSLWNFSTTGLTTASVSPGTVTVVGAAGVAIDDVVPGEGVWPAGTVVSIRGAGFTSRTSLRVADAGVRTFSVVSPSEIQFALSQPTEITGLKITVSGQINSVTYYAYMRGITAAVSSRTLLAKTEPIFSVAQRTTATFGPFAALAGNQYAALALQNPTLNDATIAVALIAQDGTLLHESTLTLAARNRVALELSELLDGVAPPANASVVVTASAPIDAIGLLCDEGAGTIDPMLPLEARP